MPQRHDPTPGGPHTAGQDGGPDLTPGDPHCASDLTPGDPHCASDLTPDDPHCASDLTPGDPHSASDLTPGDPHCASDLTPRGRLTAGPDSPAPAGLQGEGTSQDSFLTGQFSAAPPDDQDRVGPRSRAVEGVSGESQPSSPALANGGPAVHPVAPDEPAAPPAGSAAAYEAEERRQEAFDIAWRYLAHRDRTEAEVRRNFTRKRIDPALAEEVVAALVEGGYLDDAKYAQRFVEDRRNLDGWGSERIERRLNELGVDREEIRAALASGDAGDDDGHDELQAACELLARRFPQPPETPRDLERALGFLVRKGYELELAHDALRRHANATIEG